MPEKNFDRVAIAHLAEDARLGLDAYDAAAAGIGEAMRSATLDPDATVQMLALINESMKRRLDALVEALVAPRDAAMCRDVPTSVSLSGPG